MKKNLFFLAVAAVALASCSSDDTIAENSNVGKNQQKEIALMPIATPATRTAASGAQSTFPDQSMYVVAYQSDPTAKDYIGTASGGAGIEFRKNYEGGSSSASDGYWGGVTPQYWPLAKATLNFLAVTEGPASTTRVFGTETGTAGVYEHFANKVVVGMTDNKTAQHDLMYGYAQASVTQTGTNGALSIPDHFQMQFHHALAWVNFTVKAGSSAAASAIQVKNITLNGAAYSGTYTVTMPNYNSKTDNLSTGLTAEWDVTAYASASKTSKDVLDADAAIAINTSTPTNVENSTGDKKGILVAPNPDNTAASFSDFTIKYTMGGSEYSYTIAPSSLILEAGKKYTYAITFTLHEIRIEPTVETWDVVSDRAVAVP